MWEEKSFRSKSRQPKVARCDPFFNSCRKKIVVKPCDFTLEKQAWKNSKLPMENRLNYSPSPCSWRVRPTGWLGNLFRVKGLEPKTSGAAWAEPYHFKKN